MNNRVWNVTVVAFLAAVGTSVACASPESSEQGEKTGSVASAQTLRECRDECSSNSVSCHAHCGQDHSSAIDIACHRGCTSNFNDCYLSTCPIITAPPDTSTLDPNAGGAKPPKSTEPVFDTISEPEVPKLVADFPVVDTISPEKEGATTDTGGESVKK